MITPESRWEEIGKRLGESRGVVLGKMFGKLFEGAMVFKLAGETHAAALNLPESKLFDPSGNNRPMKEWVQVSFAHAGRWDELAEAALQYVQN